MNIQIVSECLIKPHLPIDDSNRFCYLTPGDIVLLNINYIQNGLLFKKPTSLANQQDFIDNLLNNLKHSLSIALVHFYPLAGRLVTHKTQDPPSYSIFVDCKNSPGAKFIHATLNMTISDILSPVDVPPIVHSLFDHYKAINHDGHTLPLLSIQVTELIDGVFIGCSMNHSIGDGASFWNFFNILSEIFQSQAQAQAQDHQHEYIEVPISQHPIHNRWFPKGVGPIINLPFKHHDEFISRFETPKLRERIFHFSAESIAKLREKANKYSNTMDISSFQSLCALVWRCITRARKQSLDEITSCKVALNTRSRINPPLPEEYFGNSLGVVIIETTTRELLKKDLGWAACKLHLGIVNHNDGIVRRGVEEWLKSPFIYPMDLFYDQGTVVMANSPRFNMYGNEFGMGKAVAVRSGYADKCDGKVTWYPGQEGGGSVDVEITLFPDNMMALESDQEFFNAVSLIKSLY